VHLVSASVDIFFRTNCASAYLFAEELIARKVLAMAMVKRIYILSMLVKVCAEDDVRTKLQHHKLCLLVLHNPFKV